MYKEIKNYNAITLQNSNRKYDEDAVFDIKINDIGNTGNAYANIVKKISYNYWHNWLYSKDLAHLLTSEIQSSYVSKLYEMADFEFNERQYPAVEIEPLRDVVGEHRQRDNESF